MQADLSLEGWGLISVGAKTIETFHLFRDMKSNEVCFLEYNKQIPFIISAKSAYLY